MDIEARIDELKVALKHCPTHADWRQDAVLDSNSISTVNGNWGSSDIVATWKNSELPSSIGKIYDSGNLFLILAMRRHIESLILEIERLREMDPA